MRERKCNAIIILIRDSQSKAEGSICQKQGYGNLSFGRLTCQQLLKLLVIVTVKHSTRTDTRHLTCRIEFISIYTVDTEALQTSLLIDITNTVTVVE